MISYYDYTNGNLKVVKCGNPSCSAVNAIVTVDSTGDVGLYTSITMGTDGLPIISYYDYTKISRQQKAKKKKKKKKIKRIGRGSKR